MLNYPALLDISTQALHSFGGSEAFLVGRSETADLCVFDVTCSRHHFRIVRRDGHYHVERLNSTNPTFRNGLALTKSEPVEHGDIIQAGRTRLQFLLRLASEETARKAATSPLPLTEPPTMMAAASPSGEGVLGDTVFSLAGVMLIGREPTRAQILLPHPQVSRGHAFIALEEKNTATLTDLGSANGTFVNGQRIRNTVALHPGDQLDIGPYALQFTGASLIPRPRSDNVELVARNIRRVVKNRETGELMTLLDDINLVIRPHEFVCLLGPSGSGKSTLLSTLSGRAAADAGKVMLNGKDLRANFEALKQDIAVVPQKDDERQL
jgi:pSer/pThr/pTyr-binding forkhead associated (FHA) protein